MFVDRPDIIILTDSWLHKGINNNELNLHGYNIFRKDRVGRLANHLSEIDDARWSIFL